MVGDLEKDEVDDVEEDDDDEDGNESGDVVGEHEDDIDEAS